MKKLFRAYYIENGRRDLFQMSILAALAMMFGFFGTYQLSFLFWLFVMVYVTRFFSVLKKNTGAVHYLTLPADTGEKWLFAFLMVNVVSVLQFSVAALIGNSLGQVASRAFASVQHLGTLPEFRMPDFFFDSVGLSLLSIYVPIAVFFFGSLYFRRYHVTNTIAVSFLFCVAFSFLMLIVVKLNLLMAFPAGTHLSDLNWDNINWSAPSPFLSYVVSGEVPIYVTSALMMVFCYVLSYFRLRETEA